MQNRCCNCFKVYENIEGLCPHCGHVEGEKLEEAHLLQPGSELNKGRYIVGQKAGQGGFGIVYKAWDVKLQRVVAIKEFFPLQMVTRAEGENQVIVFSSKREREYEAHLNRFKREANIMSLFFDTKNCINTYDKFAENGTYYIVMEYIDSPTLKSIVKARKGELLPESEVIDYVSQILSGLQEIHSKGVYHLDIALDNIFVREKNGKKEVIIYDFGAARTEKESKQLSGEEIVLKPGFAPPEQYKKNGKIGPWTDIYAVGANLYYLLTGVVPLEATDREHEDSLEEPAQINLVSPAINNATLRAMALNPDLRYKSANDFLTDLKKEKVRNAEEELRYRKKKRRCFMGLFTAVLIVVAFLIGYLAVLKRPILECQLEMWAIADDNKEMEKASYQAVIDSFTEYYPQVSVKLEVMSRAEFENRINNIDDTNRPDLIETTYADEEILLQCNMVDKLLKNNRDSFISALAEDIICEDVYSVPLGMYANVIYMQSEGGLSSLNEVTDEEFLLNASGYIESNTTLYSTVQNSVAGRYQVVEPIDKKVFLAECFSIYSKNSNEKKAAQALLEYMLTDAAQEELHITHNSGYLPISQKGFEVYVEEIYLELEFLKETIGEYSLTRKEIKQ